MRWHGKKIDGGVTGHRRLGHHGNSTR